MVESDYVHLQIQTDNSPESKDIQFTVVCDNEKCQIFTFEKLEIINIGYFHFKND